MRRQRIVWGILLAVLVGGCAPSTIQTYRPKNQEEEIVVSMLQKIPNGINQKSLDLLMQPYAPDAYIGNFSKYLGVAGPSAPVRISKAELRSAYEQVLKSAQSVTMTVRNLQLSISGDRAVAQAETQLFYKIEAGRGEARQQTLYNDVVWRLRRTPNGWRIVEEIWQ